MTDNIVCFDTQILIWGIKREATPSQEPKIGQAINLIDICQKDQSSVIIPAIVVAEILSGTPQETHSKIIQVTQTHFMIIPFDTSCAQVYARIWQENEALRKQLSKEEGVERVKAKADHLIIATAVARNATVIYSEDTDLKRFAGDFINVRPMPPLPLKQLDLLSPHSPHT